jgi:hypothetical protein
MTSAQHQRLITVLGFPVQVDDKLGHLIVEHDGAIAWDQLQAIKDAVWGEEARAIEVYPRASDVVNAGQFRHLWRLGDREFCPDLLSHGRGQMDADRLEYRHFIAWREADAVFA